MNVRMFVWFLLLTFGLSWGLLVLLLLVPEALEAAFGPLSAHHPLFILAVWSPAIAAVLVVGRTAGLAGLGHFLGRALLWRCSPGWYAFLLIGIPAIYFAGAALKSGPSALGLPTDDAATLLKAMAFMLVLGPVEEFGWRGVALPRLQQRFAPLWASLVLGAIWGLWHLPAFFLSGTPQSAWGFTPFLLGSIAISVILTPLFNDTRGSIGLAALYHFQLNNPLWPDAEPWDTPIFVAVAVIIVLYHRDTMLRRGSGVTEVVPAERGA